MEHFGRIIGHSNGTYLVEVSLKADECGGCSAAVFCGSSNGDKIIIKANAVGEVDKYKIGSRVRIRAQESDHMEAIAKLILLPLSIFMLVTFIADYLGASDLVMGLAAILSLGVVFLTIYLYQRRTRVSWNIIQVL